MNSLDSDVADKVTRAQRGRRMRRVRAGMAVFVSCMGAVALSGVMGNPRFESIHRLDVIRLMTAGAAFGVALVLLIQFFVFSGPCSDVGCSAPQDSGSRS